ncbi:MAG: transglycosylase SLT domain-containing protein [Desulfovibrionaceae bacterium]|nr:transglycosylase SLT domain-containing protein [Desulfovibrionaceae bacterium]MBF0513937.1 transglycosylase SLT domain-containing protein [Desulfovibrionaceae bacterium]
MGRLVLVVVLASMFGLAGCARQHAGEEQGLGAGNLDPELAELDGLKFSRGRPLTAEERKVLASHGEIAFHLTGEESEQVRGYVQYFLETKRDTVKRWLVRAEPHLQYVRAVLASNKLPQDLMALPFIESGYNNFAYSSSGAGGMWQFMPATARRFGLRVDYWVDERRNPYLATMASAKYLAELHGRFGDWQLALAGYNAGEGKITRAMAASGSASFKDLAKDETWLREETRAYVPKFLAMLKIIKNLKSLGFEPVHMDAAPAVKELAVPGGTDLAALARAAGMGWEEFREFNPGFRRQVSPPDASSPVYLPAARVERAQAYLAEPGSARAGYRVLVASRGDTWWRVSSSTGVPVAALRSLNPGLPDNLAPGQTYLVASDSSSLDALPLGAIDDARASGRKAGKAETAVQASAQALPDKDKTQARDAVAEALALQGAGHKPVVYRPDPADAGPAKAAAPVKLAVKAKPEPPREKSKPGSAKPEDAGKKKGKYMVAKGETVWSIARKLSVSPGAVLADNNLSADARLREGDVIYVEGR